VNPLITIVALGDSTTAGTPGFRSPLEAPPLGSGNVESQYAHWLELSRPEWRVLNRGVNGERTDQIRARFERDVAAAHPAAVVILGGVNDVYQGLPASRVEEQLDAMYSRALGAGIALVAATILPYNTATPEQNVEMRAINGWIRGRADAGRFGFCDTRAAVAAPHDPDRLAGSPDGLHPDVGGYRRMAAALEPVLAAILDRK
jgi:lysophospholipase L1-like esterase